MIRHMTVIFGMLASTPALAQDVGEALSTNSSGVLVTTHDVTTCPYHTLGAVSVNIRQDFGAKGRSAIYQKLREKALKIGANAVVLVTIGDGHMTLVSFSQKNATGRAIQYVDSACAPSQ